MAKQQNRSKNPVNLIWECKECHRSVPAEETVAYHLIDRVLYGWCESCFAGRNREVANLVAA